MLDTYHRRFLKSLSSTHPTSSFKRKNALYTFMLNIFDFFNDFSSIIICKKENLLKLIYRKQSGLCYVVQNSSSSVVLQLLRVMQSKTHKKCPSISWFAVYVVYQIAGRELEFQETRGMEGVMFACHNRHRVSLWVTQMDLSKVIREGL